MSRRAEAEAFEVDHRVATRSELEDAVEELLRRSRTEKGLPLTIQRPDYYRRIAGVLSRAEARAASHDPGPANAQGPRPRAKAEGDR